MARGMSVTLIICTERAEAELESIVAAIHAGTLDPTAIDFSALAERLVASLDISIGDGSDEQGVEDEAESEAETERFIN